MTMNLPSQLETLEALLTRGVQIATRNADALPRPGQLRLSQDIWRALSAKAGMAGIAPTGVGKSLAHMSAAALAAVDLGERTVISTNSLPLQSQFMDKDLPVVVDAVRELFGFELRCAVLKGNSNYADPLKALSLAHELTGKKSENDFRALIKLLEAGKLDRDFKPEGRGDFSSPRKLAALAAWALSVYLDDNNLGDRDSCGIDHTADDWRLVSASSDEKANEKDTGFIPKSELAKDLAGAAHIVVTNHTLLGMQAARGLPVVLGSVRLGTFHNIIVDEGHTLPDQVRSQGAAEVSARVVMQASRAVSGVLDERYAKEMAEQLAERVTKALEASVKNLSRFEDALRVPSDEQGPIAPLYDEIMSYTAGMLETVKRIGKLQSEDPKFQQKVRRAISALTRLEDAADSAVQPTSQIARWVSRGEGSFPPRFESSPVDVSGLIYNRLWNVPTPDEERDDPRPLSLGTFDEFDEDGSTVAEVEMTPLGVALVSATLPNHFNIQVALPNNAGEYESPFGEAYAGSAVFIPQVLAQADIDALKRDGAPGAKLAFDTFKHEAWCVKHIVELVRANGGSALILSAKASSGKKYADELRRQLPDLQVYSQWDGGQPARIVNAWRDDVASVLVGTKSMFTGVDAPGETNTLIVIDRPPRAAKNVIDEARVEQVTERLGDKWTADRYVYVADAASLLDQGVGRLIRSTSDRGMVAVLDPRLLTNQWSAFSYQTQTRLEFVKPLTKFGRAFNDLGKATEWMAMRRESALVPG
ncbi:ATP-dependent DNA helicase [Leucobacter sp. cx-169]|uniref:ATP-dependent DNA helicase n=1 Tax=Leucobacter sp. cx-169 TaxID=2770549 RepID=UPI00165E3639|nr:helicase C-terminal domain-containing protein [Leucobacter sp. cx-169]MBC9927360.1 hypothetical protein [Leucobacter sp. cx-169]